MFNDLQFEYVDAVSGIPPCFACYRYLMGAGLGGVYNDLKVHISRDVVCTDLQFDDVDVVYEVPPGLALLIIAIE